MSLITILDQMNEALDERVLEASVAASLDRIRKEQERLPQSALGIGA